MAIGYEAWIDEQFALPPSAYRATWEATDAALRAQSPPGSAGQAQVYDAFWKHALSGPDQLRQRVTYALSQVFVISMIDDGVGSNPRAVAAWLDMLGAQGLGSYRNLLEAVTLHPMMGRYLSHMRNQRADRNSGRVPDENYAREVMQLFSIGLVQLNEDGTPRLMGGQPSETYGAADIGGLAGVFTGWSWNCPVWPDNNCFYYGSAGGQTDPDRAFKPMLGYPQYHSPEEKVFLGSTVPMQGRPDPEASLRAALDTLAAHPNVGPFIGRQLIQRLVTSNPSPHYVRDVARVFANNGHGQRGDMQAVVKAILMHPESRSSSDRSGKVREPVLRLSAYLRAFPHSSVSGQWRVGNTDNPASSLGQTPLRAPSVFNFYRPGYVPPRTQAAAAGLVVPEMQIVHETSVAGWVNHIRDVLSQGAGQYDITSGRRDLQRDWVRELALADDPVALVADVAGRLTYGSASAAFLADLADVVGRITIPALNASGSNQAQIENARRTRVRAALLLVLASPEFLVLR